ncbi:hypothetical protein C8R46DRAFT_853810, partial [Mycena filopes]
TGEYFQALPGILKGFGVRVQLGHGVGGVCPSPKAQEDYRIINFEGMHEVALHFCGCRDAP